MGEAKDVERRQTPRHAARIPFRIPLPNIEAHGKTPEQQRSLLGYVRDVSAQGIALIASALHISEQELARLDPNLRLIVALPTGYVEMRATLIHHERINEPEQSYLLGLRISEMSDSDRALYTKYLELLGETDA